MCPNGLCKCHNYRLQKTIRCDDTEVVENNCWLGEESRYTEIILSTNRRAMVNIERELITPHHTTSCLYFLHSHFVLFWVHSIVADYNYLANVALVLTRWRDTDNADNVTWITSVKVIDCELRHSYIAGEWFLCLVLSRVNAGRIYFNLDSNLQ